MSDRNVRLEINSGRNVSLNLGGNSAPRQNLNVRTGFPAVEKDYDKLINKPQINGVTLEGNKTTRQLKIEVTDPLTNLEIEAMLASVFELNNGGTEP